MGQTPLSDRYPTKSRSLRRPLPAGLGPRRLPAVSGASFSIVRDVVDPAPAGRLALVELARDATRREWTCGEVAEASRRAAGALRKRDVAKGDVVMTLVGNRPDRVIAMLACFRLGAVVLPCNEQLRPKDLALRLAATEPRLGVCDERNADALAAAGRGDGVITVPGAELTDGEPKSVVHAQRTSRARRSRPSTGSAPSGPG